MSEQQKLNSIACETPRVGDYWHERFSPYFLIVQKKDPDSFVVLNFLRSQSPCARIDYKDYWKIDVSQYKVVTRQWIRDRVTYQSFIGFCADVARNSENMQEVVQEYIRYRVKQLMSEFSELGADASMVLLQSEVS